MPNKQRLDTILVEQGFFATRDEALRSVLAGLVSTTDRKLDKAGEMLPPDIKLHVKGQKSYASRGGLKLEGALKAFDFDPSGLICVDIGCSTGGFTDCLLQYGATHVTSVDVGRAQFDWALRQDSRVTLYERTNIVDLPAKGYAQAFDLAVCDVSFTSILHIIDAVVELLKPGASFITLVKPQFELPKEEVGEGGIVVDESSRIRVLHEVCLGMEAHGFEICAQTTSPITGHKGNVEYLVYARLKS